MNVSLGSRADKSNGLGGFRAEDLQGVAAGAEFEPVSGRLGSEADA